MEGKRRGEEGREGGRRQRGGAGMRERMREGGRVGGETTFVHSEQADVTDGGKPHA